MKKYIITTAIAATCFAGLSFAQGGKSDPSLLNVKAGDVEFTAGGRLMSDFAYYRSDFTPLKSGAAITDARIRTSLTYDELYFYADFDFTGGKFSQKDIFARYNFAETDNGTHSVKAGFYADPASMGYNTSRYQYHFISRAAPTQAFVAGRQLGVTYKFYNTHTLLDQGVFAENRYNNQSAGYQGYTAAGRWLFKALNDEDMTLHVGAAARYAKLNTGWVENNIFRQSMSFGTDLETGVDATDQFLHVDLPWASSTINAGGELLFRTNRFFARGEYIWKQVGKTRPDEDLMKNALGGLWSNTTADGYRKYNPMRNANTFYGAYVEAGFLILGESYTYDDEMGLLGGMNDDNSLEVVARYSYVNMDDIVSGEYYLRGNNTFYPSELTYEASQASGTNEYYFDYPNASTSVAGGQAHMATLGLNYTLNQYIKIMCEYKYTLINNYYYDLDKVIHTGQLKLMVSF
jgi:phosphate-selective porin OprO/OprP